jgi:hypothetical protein
MSDPSCIYTREELEKLDNEGRETLRKELEKQIQASEEIRAMIEADAKVKEVLKKKLRETYDKIKKT